MENQAKSYRWSAAPAARGGALRAEGRRYRGLAPASLIALSFTFGRLDSVDWKEAAAKARARRVHAAAALPRIERAETRLAPLPASVPVVPPPVETGLIAAPGAPVEGVSEREIAAEAFFLGG